jgi:exopolysaccharide production protein ExoQ
VNPTLAWWATFFLILYFIRMDKEEYKVSRAISLPVLWMAIIGSRLPAQWLGVVGTGTQQTYMDGNPIDRVFYFGIIFISLFVLQRRKVQWSRIFRENAALILFISYGMLSFLWSDFPDITFKRWFRDLGMYLSILVALTETNPFMGMCALFRRVGYILVLYSLTLVKYFTYMGVNYSNWDGSKTYVGVGYAKNSLGSLCLVFGLFFSWDLIRRWERRKAERKFIAVNALMIAVALRLLVMSDSKTSIICLMVGSAIMLVAQLNIFQRQPTRIVTWLIIIAVVFVPLNFVFDINTMVIQAAGRDTTLTGRSDVWGDIDKLDLNQILGAGYESFWLGERLRILWTLHPWRPNQAHNGYLESYINLGALGTGLLFVFLFATLVKIRTALQKDFQLGIFALTTFVLHLFYNGTEAAFKAHLNWFAFLIIAMAVSRGAFQQNQPLIVVPAK